MLSYRYNVVLLFLSAILVLGSCGGGSNNSPDPTPIALDRAFLNLAFNEPIAMAQPPGDDSTWFLIEKAGRVLRFDNTDAASTAVQSLDLSTTVDDTGEGGLLGIAFHPSFSGSGDVFLYYTETGSGPATPLVSKVSRFHMGTDGIISPGSESVIFSIDQPDTNHNGGDIKFGPDGYLYIALGDGGGSGDPYANGQDTTTLLGSMLRIDVDDGPLYAIPDSNIFATSGTNRPEIFAWGLRNPWRFSFDQVTEELWVGDVGQRDWEEIDIVESGGNYGWNIKEGSHCYPPGTACDDTGLIDPVFEYPRSEGRSVTGGHIYRGSLMPSFYGHYIFADWGSGKVWSFDPSVIAPVAALVADAGFNVVSFAADQDSELYVLDYSSGGIYRLSETR